MKESISDTQEGMLLGTTHSFGANNKLNLTWFYENKLEIMTLGEKGILDNPHRSLINIYEKNSDTFEVRYISTDKQYAVSSIIELHEYSKIRD